MTIDEQIECAIARCESIDWMTRNLAPARDVYRVMRRMDLINTQLDEPYKPKPPTPPNAPRPVQPHGTHSAYNRHRNRSEVPCAACVTGERDYQAQRQQRRGPRKKAA